MLEMCHMVKVLWDSPFKLLKDGTNLYEKKLREHGSQFAELAPPPPPALYANWQRDIQTISAFRLLAQGKLHLAHLEQFP